MPFDDPYEDILTAASSTPRKYSSVDSKLIDFTNTFQLPVGSTTGGRHNTGSKHYSGRAVDIKGSGAFSNEQVAKLQQEATKVGLTIRDERRHPAGQKVWGGPHIHIEVADDDPYADVVKAAGAAESDPYSDVVKVAGRAPGTDATSRRGAYAAQANQARQDGPNLDKVARDIEWHFGYGTLAALPTFTPEQQQKIVSLATQYAAEDEAKKAKGQFITKSPAWQLANQRLVGIEEGKTFEARTRPEVDAAQRAAFKAGGNPYLQVPSGVRMVLETLNLGGAGVLDLAAGLTDIVGGRKSNVIGNKIREMTSSTRADVAAAQEYRPQGKLTTTARDVGAGVIEFAPLMLAPEASVEGVFAKIGEMAIKGGLYTGTQEIGRGGGVKEVAKTAGVGAAQFGLMGVPLPGKGVLAKAAANLLITGGGTTLINRATGQPWSDAATQGIVMSLMRTPELLHGLKVSEGGKERPATVRDIKGLLPGAKFDLSTNVPIPEAETPPGPEYARTRQAIVTEGSPTPEQPHTVETEQALEESKLSQQYPGTVRLSEDSARANLLRMKEEFERLKAKGVKKTPAEKRGMGELKRTIDELEKGGAGSLPEKPNVGVEGRERPRWSTREQLDATPEQLRLMQREQAAAANEPKPADTNPAIMSTPSVKAGQEGNATLDAISLGSLGKLEKLRQTAVTMVQRSGVVGQIKALRDAVDVKADNYAVTKKNDVEQPLRRLVGKEYNLAKEALTSLIESKVKSFAEQRDVLNSSTQAPEGWKKKALAAIDYAEANQARLQPIADEYSRILEEQRVYENGSGIPTAKFEGYVPRRVDYESGDSLGYLDESTGSGVGKAFTKVRVHQTMADLIASGQNPKSIDAVGLMTDRIARGQRAVNQRLWTADLKTTVDPKTNTPVATEPVTIKRADGTNYQAAPDGYTLVDGLAVRRGYQSIYRDLVNPNWLSDSKLWSGYRAANSLGKSLILMVDTFHLARMAVAESVLKGVGGVEPGKTVRVPLPSYKRGLDILDFSAKEIGERVKSSEYSPEYAKGLLESKRIAQLYLDNGLNIGKIADNFHNTLVHSVPWLRNINHFIFNSFQRGAMMEVAELEYHRLKNARPELSDVEIVRKTKTDLNAIFGSLGRQGVFTSQWLQDVARGVFLAPQWREGLIRRELGAVNQVGEFAKDTAQGKTPYLGTRLRLVGSTAASIFIANQIINLATRGYPTWQNPEDGFGSKISAWVPDYLGKSDGFFLNPMGIAMETFHSISSYYSKAEGSKKEKAYDAAAKYGRSGLSYGVRPFVQLLTGRDDMGRLIKPDNRATDFAKQWVPQPIQGSTVTGAARQGWNHLRYGIDKDEQQYPGQYQSQLMASTLGLKTERLPPAGQRITKAASEFNFAHGIERPADFYESLYAPLTSALGTPAAKEAVEKVIAAKMQNDFTTRQEAVDSIAKYYETRPNKPLTGSAEKERVFLKGLTPEQRADYETLKKRRYLELNEVRKVLK